LAGNTTITKNVNKQPSNHSSSPNNAIATYITNVGIMSGSSAYQYLSRLNNFENFVSKEYDSRLTINDLITKIKKATLDPYSVLTLYRPHILL
jgi:hypothetical protein